MEKTVTLEAALLLVKQLSLVDKVRLIEQVAPEIERELTAHQNPPRKSLRGLWKGLDLSEADIDAARREVWGNFPREDV